MVKMILYGLVIVLVPVPFALAGEESLTVCGQGMCGTEPITSKNGWVALLNKRTGFDDKKEVPFSNNGSYCVTLTINRWCMIKPCMEPELHMYTDCNDKKLGIPKGCQRKLVCKIPSKYVNAKANYYVGNFQLELKLKDESRDCSTKRSWGVGKK